VVWTSRIGVGLVTGLAGILTIRSLQWPLVHDGPLLHYIAAQILDGAVCRSSGSTGTDSGHATELALARYAHARASGGSASGPTRGRSAWYP
jgi:hypothetical protein